jgi:hypothetical protein
VEIPGIHVQLQSTSYGNITKAGGRVASINIPAGKYIVVASDIGLETENKEEFRQFLLCLTRILV